MPSKHQPDFSYLRHVPLRKVHLFTLVQITCLAVLWILKSTFLAIIFPVMVGTEALRWSDLIRQPFTIFTKYDHSGLTYTVTVVHVTPTTVTIYKTLVGFSDSGSNGGQEDAGYDLLPA